MTTCSMCGSAGHETADHGAARGYRRAELLAEISDRADELEAPRRHDPDASARDLLAEAGRASEKDPLSGGVSVWRTASMLRRCALDCAAYAFLALEKLSEARR